MQRGIYIFVTFVIVASIYLFIFLIASRSNHGDTNCQYYNTNSASSSTNNIYWSGTCL